MNKYLQMLQKDIHTVIFATSDSKGCPVTCAIDLMLYDEDGLYFLTAKGKSFFKRLKSCPFISLTGIKGENTMTSVSITVRGKVKETGSSRLEEIFRLNPYMTEIYPTAESRRALTVFQIYKGSGEYFDLSCRPIFRESFSFGDAVTTKDVFHINDKCIGCGKCLRVCPQNCIDTADNRASIRQENCLHCGRCMEVCPVEAVERNII